MLHRFTRTAALLGVLLAAGCKSSASSGGEPSKVTKTEVVTAIDAGPPGPDAKPDPTKLNTDHGDKWQDEDSLGAMAMFKEAWVYVDGQPVGVLRESELPPIPKVWVDQIEELDFKKGDPGPHQRIYQTRRWRLSDYLEEIGVPLKKVKLVMLHGGRGTVFISGDDFRKTKDDLQFDLIGNDNLKLRFYLPGALRPKLNTSFDRYAAVSIVVDKPVPVTNEYNDVVLDGVVMEGIPFYGQPLRGGIRVYLDGRLAVIIKRNSLGDEGRVAPGKDEWNVQQLIEARGIELAKIGAIDMLDPVQRVTRIDGAELPSLTFSAATQASGAMRLSNGQLTNALMLWSEGKVPPPRVPEPSERDKPGE